MLKYLDSTILSIKELKSCGINQTVLKPVEKILNRLEWFLLFLKLSEKLDIICKSGQF